MALNFKTFKKSELILSFDPSIESGYDEYLRSHCDVSKLRFKANSEPTKFICEPLTQANLDLVDQISNHDSRIKNKLIIAHSLRNVDNLTIDDKKITKVDRIDSYGQLVVSDEWFNNNPLPTKAYEELATMIMRISEPDPI